MAKLGEWLWGLMLDAVSEDAAFSRARAIHLVIWVLSDVPNKG